MRTLLVLFFSIICITSLGYSQTWTFDSVFKTGAQPHGVVVDANGLIWVGWYRYSDTLGMPQDTIPIAPIWVFNPDGSEASFSPIRTFEVDGVLDTMDSYCRGLSLDQNGNVLFVGNQIMLRFNYQTGEAMNKYMYVSAGSLTSPACDDNGYIYLTKVVPSSEPIVILDEDFELYSYVTESYGTIQRSMVVSGDGKDVYIGTIYAGVNGVRRWHSDDGPDGEYALTDTLGSVFHKDATGIVSDHAMWGQSVDWNNGRELLWVGTYWDVAATDFSGWYALDPTQNFAIVDTLGHNFDMVLGDGAMPAGTPTDGSYKSPRHIAFSADGKTAYAADFDGGQITKWTNAAPKGQGSTPIGLDQLVSIRYKDGRPQIAVDFDLQQNFPNPFNPTTKIPFDITKAVDVKLVIFDVNGRQVRTLVNERLMPQHYEYEFDASNLASGTYFYQLDVNGIKITKQMLLIK